MAEFDINKAGALSYSLKQIQARLPILPAGTAWNAGGSYQGGLTKISPAIARLSDIMTFENFDAQTYDYYTLIGQFAIHNYDTTNTIQLSINQLPWKRVLPGTYYAETGIEVPFSMLAVSCIGGAISDCDINVWYLVSHQ